MFIEKPHLLAIILIPMMSSWIGCMTTTKFRAIRDAPTGIEPGQALTTILSCFAGKGQEEWAKAEKEIAGCIAKAMRDADPHLRIVSADEFRRTAFPGLDLRVAHDELATMTDYSEFRERVAPLRLRYIVIVGGSTRMSGEWFGGIIAKEYPPGILVFGREWLRASKLEAEILDIQQGCKAGRLTVTSTGRPCIGTVILIPVGWPAFTESQACEELGKAVTKFILQENGKISK